VLARSVTAAAGAVAAAVLAGARRVVAAGSPRAERRVLWAVPSLERALAPSLVPRREPLAVRAAVLVAVPRRCVVVSRATGAPPLTGRRSAVLGADVPPLLSLPPGAATRADSLGPGAGSGAGTAGSGWAIVSAGGPPAPSGEGSWAGAGAATSSHAPARATASSRRRGARRAALSPPRPGQVRRRGPRAAASSPHELAIASPPSGC
jgi:hypothetical protein